MVLAVVGGVIGAAVAMAGGSLLRPDGTLRQALDAALSSPSGIGVAVNSEGTVIGGFRAADVLDIIEAQRKH